MLQVFSPATFASYIWPSAVNMYNDNANLDLLVATTSTASNSKKGFLFTGNPQEIFSLGAGHIAINVTLSGKGHTFIEYLDGLKKRGVKITLILVNDNPPTGVSAKDAPPEYRNPHFYMIDFFANNGQWQKYNFDRILEDYGKYADNWIIGNEINAQDYNFYGPADIESYTKVYCDSFRIMYRDIKEVNPAANVFISFDQGWDVPEFRTGSSRYDKERGKYRYNAKEQLPYLDKYLGRNMDYGIALHPYPTPVEEAMFWDDEHAGYDENAENDKERPYLLTACNFDIAIKYLNDPKFYYMGLYPRKLIISELGFTANNGEEIQAAGLYYVWEKVCKYDQIIALLYNAQTDVETKYHFGLTSDKKRKRLIWTVFRDMDRGEDAIWCKDLLDRILEEKGYVDIDGFIFKKEELEEKQKKSDDSFLSKIIHQPKKTK